VAERSLVNRSELSEAELARARRVADDLGGIMPGHWQSPYPSRADIERAAITWDGPPDAVAGVALRPTEQLELVRALATFKDEVDLAQPDPERRFRQPNGYFGAADAEALYGMLRQVAPQRIIEVGSGFSTALMLDVNEQFFDNRIECVLIDPDPSRLEELLRAEDFDRVHLSAMGVQDVPLSTFDSLRAGDVLFIDSSHVVKMGSDVNFLFFEVLPRLPVGAHVHLHDIFYPFDYPRAWIEHHHWIQAEAYLLRAFLQYNTAFEISLFCDYLLRFFRAEVASIYPRLAWGKPGSIWLQRVA
jgi:hypothetical protein